MGIQSPAKTRLLFGIGTFAVGIGAALAGSGAAHADGHRGPAGDNPAHAAAADHPAPRPAAVMARHAPAPAHTVSPPQPSFTGVALAPSAPAPAPAATTYTATNTLSPRLQWNTNDGYCGETSFVSASLYYGQYMSQYDARSLASPGVPQNKSSSQLLLGVNDVAAAKAMHLTATPFNTAAQTDSPSFLKWVKSSVISGYPIAIGLYTNEFRFYDDTDPNAGDPQYDHIVTVTGVSSKQPLAVSAPYYADDVITFSDHGLWTGTPAGQPQDTFSYPFGTFALTRRKANTAGAPVYSLPATGKNYGIAITGVVDLNHETVPVRLTTSVNAENPAMAEGATKRPVAKPVTLTVTVSNLTAGKTYNLYRYASMAAVPDSNFNANAAKATQKWQIVATGPTYTMTQTVMSNEIAAYRAVPTTAR